MSQINTASPVQNNKVKEIIGKAKAIPASAYLLVLLNIIMLVGLVFQDLPLHYFVGRVLFSLFLVVALGQITTLWKVPTKLISQNTQNRIKQLEQKVLTYVKSLHADDLQSKSVNTIITILVIIYFSSILNGTLEIFLVVNFVYCLIFLSNEIEKIKNCCTKCCGQDLLSKIKYTK